VPEASPTQTLGRFAVIIHNVVEGFDLTARRNLPILIRFGRGRFLCLWWKEGLLSGFTLRSPGEAPEFRNGGNRGAAGMGRQPRKAE